jgi:hypothetical protein
MEETGPEDPNISKLLTGYAYCCKWANINPFDEYSSLSEELDIRVTYRPDYNYSPGSSGSYYDASEPDKIDITEYNSKTVIALLSNEKKQIIIDDILEEFFDEERFRYHYTISKFKFGN